MNNTKYLLIICLLLTFLGAIRTLAQVNLVPNPGFESYTTCPNDFAQLGNTVNWYPPTDATPDYFNACAFATSTPIYYSQWVPNNALGYQKAYNNSTAYAGFVAYEGRNAPVVWKEYVQAQLTNSLSPGQKYYLSFYLSLSDRSGYATDVIGAYFSQTSVSLTGTSNFSFTPQVTSPAGAYLTDSLSWMRISGSFTATGGEQYITIGVFKEWANTANIIMRESEGTYYYAYYFLDEVCLSTSSVTCKVGLDVGVNERRLEEAELYYDQTSKKIIFKENLKDYSVIITNSMGKAIRTTQPEWQQEIDASDLPSGCYFIYLSNVQGGSVKKIMVN